MNALLRPALETDLEAINAIYNHYVETSTASYDLVPMSLEQRRNWWSDHDGYPVLVLESPSGLVGWASLSAYRGRPGYRHTVENSVYVVPAARGQSLGTRLLSELLAHGRAAGFHTVLAMVESTQTPSIRLHLKCGFRQVGILEEVGRKFDRWLSTIVFQRHLF